MDLMLNRSFVQNTNANTGKATSEASIGNHNVSNTAPTNAKWYTFFMTSVLVQYAATAKVQHIKINFLFPAIISFYSTPNPQSFPFSVAGKPSFIHLAGLASFK